MPKIITRPAGERSCYENYPEEEYRTLVENLGGTYIDFMSGHFRINILEPKRWAVEDMVPIKKQERKR